MGRRKSNADTEMDARQCESECVSSTATFQPLHNHNRGGGTCSVFLLSAWTSCVSPARPELWTLTCTGHKRRASFQCESFRGSTGLVFQRRPSHRSCTRNEGRRVQFLCAFDVAPFWRRKSIFFYHQLPPSESDKAALIAFLTHFSNYQQKDFPSLYLSFWCVVSFTWVNISELHNSFQIVIGIVEMVKITKFIEMGMVAPFRPIYYLNLFDQLCQPWDSLKKSGIAEPWWNCVLRNVNQQYEEEVGMEKVCWQRHIWEKWQSWTLLGDHYHRSTHSVTLFFVQFFFNSCPSRSWCFWSILWLNLHTFLFVCFFKSL